MTLRRTAALTAALSTVALAAVLGAGTAVAEPSPPAPFGEHVRTCAQDMGLDGSHNPGMHLGAAPWHSDQHIGHHDGHSDGDHHC